MTKHSTIMDRYDPERRVAMIVDEWGTWYDVAPGTNPRFLYQQNTLRDALVAGLNLNIFNAHADRVRMANIAQTINVLQTLVLTDGARMVTTPTYHVFDMYQVHQDATLVPCVLQTEPYRHYDQEIPQVSVSASRNAAGRVHLMFCNVDPHQKAELRCDVRGYQPSAVSGTVLTAPTMQAHNTFDAPQAIQPVSFDGARLVDGGLTITLPPMSVTAVAL